LGETTGNNTIDQPLRFHRPGPALIERSRRETTTHCAHVTYHQKNILLFGNQRKPFANRITLAQTEQIVIKEEDPDHIRAVSASLELRQDHAREFVTARHISGKHIGNSHVDTYLVKNELSALAARDRRGEHGPISILDQHLPSPHTFGGFVAAIAVEACRRNS
jgi:hypothetical protein